MSSAYGVKPNPQKVEAIKTMPVPVNQEELKLPKYRLTISTTSSSTMSKTLPNTAKAAISHCRRIIVKSEASFVGSHQALNSSIRHLFSM